MTSMRVRSRRAEAMFLVDRNSDAPLLRYAVALALICVSIAVVNRGQRMEETGER